MLVLSEKSPHPGWGDLHQGVVDFFGEDGRHFEGSAVVQMRELFTRRYEGLRIFRERGGW